MITDLNVLLQEEIEKEEENIAFRQYIKTSPPQQLDEWVMALNEQIAPQISCTDCGNCCQSLMVNITQPECERTSAFMNMSVGDFKEKYVETSLAGNMVINKVPCHFLDGKVCSVYEHRFTECREFPHLHKPGFATRMFGTLMHYGRCPIIYNVVEALKTKTGFKQTGQVS
jgi:uncharacterized protein